MGSWPPISPLLSPYGNGFGDPQGIPLLDCLMYSSSQQWVDMLHYVQTSTDGHIDCHLHSASPCHII